MGTAGEGPEIGSSEQGIGWHKIGQIGAKNENNGC